MAHTPGPWRAVKQNVESFYVIYAGKIQVADLYGITGERDEEGQDEFISNDESAANARLIAAAPDLLEACETALADCQLLEKIYRTEKDYKLMALLSAAIKKAKGEA
jgi:hypothetical protein